MSQRIEEHAYIRVRDDVCFWDDDDNLIWEIKKGTSIVAIVSTKDNCQTAYISNPDQLSDTRVAERHQTLDNQKEFLVLDQVPEYDRHVQACNAESIGDFDDWGDPEAVFDAKDIAEELAEKINTYRHDPLEVLTDFLREHGCHIETRRAA